MLEELEFTARIRPAAKDRMGDDLPEDLHHGHTVTFNAKDDSFELRALDDRNKEKRIPLTAADLTAINKAFDTFVRMRSEASNA